MSNYRDFPEGEAKMRDIAHLLGEYRAICADNPDIGQNLTFGEFLVYCTVEAQTAALAKKVGDLEYQLIFGKTE